MFFLHHMPLSLLCWQYISNLQIFLVDTSWCQPSSCHSCCLHSIWLNYNLLWLFSGPLAYFQVTWNSLFLLSTYFILPTPPPEIHPWPPAPSSYQTITSCCLIQHPIIPFFTAQWGTPVSTPKLPLLIHHLLWPTTIQSNYLYIIDTFVPYGCSSWTPWPWRWMQYDPAKYQVLLT